MSIALVTGSSRGLGRNMLMHLAAKGHDAILTYKSNKTQAEEVVGQLRAQGRKALALPLDVSGLDAFTAFAAAVKQALRDIWQREDFDILINNAGIGVSQPFMETTPEQFDRLLAIHLKGPFFLTQTLLPLMKDGGRIVNISSGLTRVAIPGFAAYAAMKGGVEALTRYLAKELGGRGIRVLVVAPGPIETDFDGGRVRDDKHVNEFLASHTALGRVGLPDDIGGAVAALITEDCRWINGQRIEVSGGFFL